MGLWLRAEVHPELVERLSSESDSGSTWGLFSESGMFTAMASCKWSMCHFHSRPGPTLTTYDKGPVCWTMVPRIYLGPFGRKLRTITLWLMPNLRSLTCWSCCANWLACLSNTCLATSGWISDNLVRTSCWKKSELGVQIGRHMWGGAIC